MTKQPSTNARKQWPRRTWLALAAVTTALGLAPDTAAATTSSGTSAPVDVAVSSYAADYNVDIQEAQRRLDRIQPIQQVLDQIRSLESTRVAGWGIDHTGAFTGWVWLTGDQPADPDATDIAHAHPDVEIRTGAAHTYDELLTAQRAFADDVVPIADVPAGTKMPAQAKYTVTYTSVNMRANSIRIGIDPAVAVTTGGLMDSPASGVSNDTLRSRVAEVTQRLKDHLDVAYIVEDGRWISSETSFSAGENVRVEVDDDIFICTSGFTAQENNGGALGVITAGHCGDDGPNEGATISIHEITLPYANGWAGVNADAQFHKIPTGSSHELRDSYLCEVYNRRAWCDVTGDVARDDMINDYVCHTGQSSGISCGTVINTSHQPRYPRACWSSGNDVTSCNHVFVEVTGPSLKSCRGDSGGPWYRSGVAYGIHKGSNSKNDCDKTSVVAHFSAILEVEDFLDVQILTDGNVTIE